MAALVVVAAGLATPAGAQGTTCTTTAVTLLARAESYAEPMGDVIVTCIGGTPTTAGQQVPKATLSLGTSGVITSKMTDSTPTSATPFTEALLMIDGPNTQPNTQPSAHPLLACGQNTGPIQAAYDSGNPGVCTVIAPGGGGGASGSTYDGANGHPNVFQGRQSLSSVIQFTDVPIDPPAPGDVLTLRITNVRINLVGFSGVLNAIVSSVTPSVIYVQSNIIATAIVRSGISSISASAAGPYPQCGPIPSTGGSAMAIEGFASAFKAKNWAATQTNGIPNAFNSDLIYKGSASVAAHDLNQNVPGALYITESGFLFIGPPGTFDPTPNAPLGRFGQGQANPNSVPFPTGLSTGIDQAGTVTNGTRLAFVFSNVPAGSNATVPNLISLQNAQQGSGNPVTGVMALVTGADANGAGGTITTSGTTALSETGSTTVIYEVLFADENTIEQANVPVTINATPGSVEMNKIAQVSVGFAPSYGVNFSPNPGVSQPMTGTGSLPIQRFLANPQTVNLFSFTACVPDLAITKLHVGNFTVGQTGASYSIVVNNVGAATTTAAVTVTEAPPAGLTVTAMSGTGWTCTQPAGPCSRSDALARNNAYPPITATANVGGVIGTITNIAAVSGGGDTNLTNNSAADPATVIYGASQADLVAVSSHTGNFAAGQTGATYTVNVSNLGTGPTSGAVNVTDTVPSGLIATHIAGTGWACTQPAGPCTRTDSLAGGGSYPGITLIVNVAVTAPALATNLAMVSGGNEIVTGNDTSNDPTVITKAPPGISAGNSHVLQLAGDGRVWAWGDNSFGELGDGTNVTHSIPMLVPGISSVVQVAAGNSFSLALKSDGTVWAWGYNGDGALGNGTSSNYAIPVQVSALSGVIAISTFSSHCLALKSDGTVWAWGSNFFGELGIGSSQTTQSVPVQVGGLSNIAAVAAGNLFSLALKGDGTIVAWGYNANGAVGDSTTINRLTPVPVAGLLGVVQIDAGEDSFAITSDNQLWGWGYNGSGALGNGTVSFAQTVPIQVALTGVVSVANGTGSTYALRTDGTVWGWGDNSWGELGIGSIIFHPLPVQISGVTGVIALASGGLYALALKTGDAVSAWGYNTSGQLGNGTISYGPRTIPSQVPGLAGMIGAAVSPTRGIALRQDGTVWAWGSYVGDGTSVNRTSPVQVSNLTQITAIAAGWGQALALRSDGTVWSWGYGDLGDGTTNPRSTPGQVVGLSGVVAIAAGYSFSLAVKSDGTVWTWGENDQGQLGDGTTTQRLLPVQVSGLNGVISVAAGSSHSLALKSDGTVWAWGSNIVNQLGDGTSIQRLTPVQVSSFTGGVAIAAGMEHSIALKSDGTVWTWGYNADGELGDATEFSRATPVQASGINGVTAVAGGANFTMALRSDGYVWSWGKNDHGQLADETETTTLTPLPIAGSIHFSAIAADSAGYQGMSLAVAPDGTVWQWGTPIIDANISNTYTPQNVVSLGNVPDLTLRKTHTGNFTQGQTNATYTLVVTNSGNAPTIAPISVTDNIPLGLSVVSVAGPGWVCFTTTCIREDLLAPSASYPPITVTVNVSPTAPASVTNMASVSGGGESNNSNNSASDPTAIDSGTAATPTVVSLSPINGSGNATFSAQVADVNGVSDIGLVYLLFNTSLTPHYGCLVAYDNTNNFLLLYNDAGTGLVSGTLTPGTGGTLSNTRCRISGIGSSVSTSGNILSVNVPITFLNAFVGINAEYVYVVSKEQLASGYVAEGSWTGNTDLAPTIPTSQFTGTGSPQTFNVNFNDATSGENIALAYVIFGENLVLNNTCVVAYSAGVNTIYLLNDAGTGLAGGITPGVAGTASNSQCTVASGGATSVAGTTLMLPVNITFAANFGGLKNAWGYALSATGLNSGFVNIGSWSANANVAPGAISMPTPSGTGNGPYTMQVAYSDANGYLDLEDVTMLVSGNGSAVNACEVVYAPAYNAAFLLNDAATSFVPGYVTLGVAGAPIANSHCTLQSGGAPANSGATNLTVPLQLTFTGFTGSKTIYGQAFDASGGISAFQTLGTLTLP